MIKIACGRTNMEKLGLVNNKECECGEA